MNKTFTRILGVVSLAALLTIPAVTASAAPMPPASAGSHAPGGSCHVTTPKPAHQVKILTGTEDFTWNLSTGAAAVTGTFLSGTGTITHETGPVYLARFGSCTFDVIPVPAVNAPALAPGTIGVFVTGTPSPCRFWSVYSDYQVHGHVLTAQVRVAEAA
jgi:hypothetical protein